MTRVEQESALRLAIMAERETPKSIAHRSLDEHYRAFLAQQAQPGDKRALVELRCMRCIEPGPHPTHVAIRLAAQQESNAIIHRGSGCGHVLTHEVQRNDDVVYKRNGCCITRRRRIVSATVGKGSGRD